MNGYLLIGGNEEFWFYDVSNPAAPRELSRMVTPNRRAGAEAETHTLSFARQGDTLYMVTIGGTGIDTSLLSAEIERDWTAYSIYDHDDLEPTSFDCLSCHRPGGQGTQRILRMQELESPWLHWFPQRFVQRTDSDRVLLPLFAEAHA